MPVPFLIAALIWAELQPFRLIFGALLASTGELLRIQAVRYAGGATRTRNVGAAHLVTSGPYAHMRNPLYLGNIAIYLGYALASGALFPYLPMLVLLYFSFQYALIVALEEKTLAELFGEEYAEYCRKVPRLWPRLTVRTGNAQPDCPLSEALTQESRTLQGFFIAWLLLAGRWMLF